MTIFEGHFRAAYCRRCYLMYALAGEIEVTACPRCGDIADHVYIAREVVVNEQEEPRGLKPSFRLPPPHEPFFNDEPPLLCGHPTTCKIYGQRRNYCGLCGRDA
jgi:hypothetical protein